MDIAILVLLALNLTVLIVLCILLLRRSGRKQTDEIRRAVKKEERQQSERIDRSMAEQRRELTETVSSALSSFGSAVASSQSAFRESMEQRIGLLEKSSTEQLSAIRAATEQRLSAMQNDNNTRLEKMEALVDEKLQTTLESRITQSFRLVSEELEKVYRGLGEMQTVASGVNDLKKVLSNVKTRGILGEVQLGAVLEEILAPEQYRTNVATKKGSRDMVEFAIKLPGNGADPVFLPIDSKFPGDAYSALLAAYDSGDTEKINAAAARLMAQMKKEARDIADKYLDPPFTTDFGVMFLPFEGLYAEAVNRGMVETLQREYKINVAGPSTMAAFLNSLQMGFKTLAVQKRTGEITQLLSAFRTEFDKFQEVLEASQRHLRQASGDLEQLIGARTRSIQTKLNAVEQYKDGE